MMHPLRSAAVSITVILVLCPPLAATSPSIGVFLDRDCTLCSGTANILVPFTFYISARLEPPLSDGISGAAFQVVGLPASWNTLYVPMVTEPSPGLLVVGDPFGFGVNVAFTSGCSGPGVCVPLLACHVTPFATETNVRMRIVAPHPVLCLPFCCILLYRCDPPYYTAMCVPGGEAVFNGPPCTVGVTQATWTQVKRLYD